MLITAYFESSGLPKTGITPLVNVRNVSTGALVVNALAMTEVGDGFYRYDFSAYDYSIAYSLMCDGGALLSDADRYVQGQFVYGEGASSTSGGASIVEIANQALYMLGQTAIISMTDDSEAARLCNGRFVYNRDATLRAYPWNCAITRATLARSSVAPVWEYDYKYALPTFPLCLRVLDMEERQTDGYKYKIEGRWLITDATTCNIIYLAQLTDVNEMDVLLKETIAARLAADICFALTGSSAQQKIMWDIYEQKIRLAKSCDAQEGIPDSEETWSNTFLNARN